MMMYGNLAVQRSLRGIANLSKDEKDLLVDLYLLVIPNKTVATTVVHTQEPSDTEITRGANREERLTDI